MLLSLSWYIVALLPCVWSESICSNVRFLGLLEFAKCAWSEDTVADSSTLFAGGGGGAATSGAGVVVDSTPLLVARRGVMSCMA